MVSAGTSPPRKDSLKIDYDKVKAETRYDEHRLSASEIAKQYKQLSMMERFFRAAKLLPERRPIFHRTDHPITGHLFCSFLSLFLMHELTEWLERRGWTLEWADILHDLMELEEVKVVRHGKRYLLRTPLVGVCGKVLQGAGVAIPPPVKEEQEDAPHDAKTPSLVL